MRSVLDDQHRADGPPVHPGLPTIWTVDPGESVAADELFAPVEDHIGPGRSDRDDQLTVDEQMHRDSVAHTFGESQ